MDLGHKFKHKPIIKIDNITLSMESLIKIEKSNICIFQSKNTMNQLKSHQDLFNKSKTYYAVGVFTARSVEKSINVDCKYPKKNFSSRDLVEEYKLDRLRNKKWFVAPITSSLIGSFFDTFLFFSISFYGTGVPWITLSLGDLAVKVFVALIMLIPFRLLLGTFKAA